MKAGRMSEPQYSGYINRPRARLGLRANEWYETDPRSLLFSLARYEFVAKMLSGSERVLEVGCGDAWGTRLVQQEVGRVTAVDFDPVFVRDVIERQSEAWPLDVYVHDILRGPVTTWEGTLFHAVYALDVLEHIAPADEALFMRNLIDSIEPGGMLILGTPSKESQAYASAGSRAGHVNCKTGEEFLALMKQYCDPVFTWSMNDTAVYPGFSPMARYLLAVGMGQY